jgi:purine-binding chemotaxis protein CheW
VGEELTLLEFRLDEQRFAIACELVSEVLPMLPIRPLPNAPEVILGVAAVRGTLLPLIDPRVRLGIEPAPLTMTCHILAIDAAGKRVGLVVDSAEEVFTVPASQICKPGGLEPRVPYGVGMLSRGAAQVVLIDIDALVNHDEWPGLADAIRAAS